MQLINNERKQRIAELLAKFPHRTVHEITAALQLNSFETAHELLQKRDRMNQQSFKMRKKISLIKQRNISAERQAKVKLCRKRGEDYRNFIR